MIPVIVGTIGLFVAALIVLLIRRDRLHVAHGMGWMVVAGGFALLGFTPELIDRAALFLGVAYPPTLALTLGIAVLVIKIFLMDVERSRIEVRNQRLAQRMAMLEADLHKAQQERKDFTVAPDAETASNLVASSGETPG
jgi:hypothetical protein